MWNNWRRRTMGNNINLKTNTNKILDKQTLQEEQFGDI
jgi:hypothetical protein